MLSIITTFQLLPENYPPSDYQPNTLITYKIAQRENLSFITFAAAWCPDSIKGVPKIVKLEDALPNATFEYVAHLPRSKKDDAGLTEKYQITRVPTLVVLQNGVEIGKIIEFPKKSWEEDIYEIILLHEAKQRKLMEDKKEL